MLVLVEAQRPVAAWIYQPATGDLYCGERGGGVWHVAPDGAKTRLRPAAPTNPKRLIGIASGNLEIDGRRVYRSQRADRFAALNDMRCPGIDYPRLMTGEAHFTVYAKCLPWDHLPGIMMMREVGWVDERLDREPYGVTDLAGGLMCAPSPDALEAIRRRLTL
jgi:fructose-1,6-bisphosphatase/inositol monophosphatase family enzyme